MAEVPPTERCRLSLALPVGLSAKSETTSATMSAVADEAGCFEPGFSSVSAVIKVDCLAKECPTNGQASLTLATSRYTWPLV